MTNPNLTLHTDNTQYCLTNGTGYYSLSMATGKPVFLSKGMCYTFTLAEAQKVAESLTGQGYTVQVVKY